MTVRQNQKPRIHAANNSTLSGLKARGNAILVYTWGMECLDERGIWSLCEVLISNLFTSVEGKPVWEGTLTGHMFFGCEPGRRKRRMCVITATHLQSHTGHAIGPCPECPSYGYSPGPNRDDTALHVSPNRHLLTSLARNIAQATLAWNDLDSTCELSCCGGAKEGFLCKKGQNLRVRFFPRRAWSSYRLVSWQML